MPDVLAIVLLCVAAVIVLYAVLVILPTRLVRAADLTHEQLLKARNDVRSSLLVALGGASALIGAFAGGYVGLQQLEINREGQLTDRFSRAIDQLGDDTLDIRLGGIYALERIARDSRADHPQIMQVLAAFLRTQGRLSRAMQALPEGERPGLDEEFPL